MKWLIRVIWLIDILDINIALKGINCVGLGEFLDITLPINTLFWLIYWILLD